MRFKNKFKNFKKNLKNFATLLLFFLILVNVYLYIDDKFEKIPITGAVIFENTSDKNLYLHFCPREPCEEILIKYIKNSKKTIDCAFFDIDKKSILDTFKFKSKEVPVRLYVDEKNKKGLEPYDFIRFDKKGSLSHNKFCIFDGGLLMTGSMNPTYRGTETNNNNLVFVKSKSLVENYEREFEELHSRSENKRNVNSKFVINNISVENYFCPEDFCANKIIKLLRQAKESIYFMTFSFTHPQIGDAIVEKHNKGIDVKGIFEKSQNNAYTQKTKFEEDNISVKFDSNPANMHHKVFIIDNKIVITGSMNPSKNGDLRNDENVLIIHDENFARAYLDEFDSLW